MNAMLPLFAQASTLAGVADRTANILAAARTLATYLGRSRTLDRRLVSQTLTLTFGASDAEGAWSWKDAYDAVEAAVVLQVRRLAPQVGRLEDAPAEIATLLAGLAAFTPTQTRRSEEQVAMDQFSTPPELAVVALAAAQVRPGDRVLEPSAGTGLLAIVAEACGGAVTLNELSDHRGALLDGLFSAAPRFRHDAAILPDLLETSGSFHAVVTNPPFQALEQHLHSAIACLADGGRLSAIVPSRIFEDRDAMAALARKGRIVGRLVFPARAFARHGTSVETGLLVVDRGQPGAVSAQIITPEDLAALARAAAGLDPRPTAQARTFRQVSTTALLQSRAREAAAGSSRLAFLSTVTPVAYATKSWAGEGREVGLYAAYGISRINLENVPAHPSPLVESAAMASTPPPAPTYRPVLPATIVGQGLISDAQMESVIYAGEAHGGVLPGWWKRGNSPHEAVLVPEGSPEAMQFRRGYFVGDGTGVGKGRLAATLIADNMAQGRMRAVWVSKNEALLEDARRDWTGIGGTAADLTPQSAWKQFEGIRLQRGILFTTYATLRQPARRGGRSRLEQITDWLGADFDGVIVFDEAHAMANAAGGGKGNGGRGPKKASLQGQAGLALQNLLPGARMVYVSATGATTPENLAYASRLGLWGGPEAPFNTREDFLDAVEHGGVAVMELIARELKSLGLYNARSLSFDGVEYEPARHELTPEDIEIWDAWADAYQIIHTHLSAALEATGVTDQEGKPKSALAASAAKSAFESSKLRFFAALLSGLKAPSLIRSIRADLAEGRCAVVQVVSTNEAVMERRLSEIPPDEWNNLTIDLTPKDTVLDYLKSAFPTDLMQEITDEDGEVVLQPVRDEHGATVQSQEALRLREALVTELACLPAVQGVLDAVNEAFGTEEVAEITGRSRRVVTREGRRVVERRSASAARAETDAFMAGRKRILVFSDAGGTGRSYHACNNSSGKDRRRVHYLAEPGWRADAAIQGLGRSHRTNQASAPLFRPVTTDIKGEKRFLSTIARRLNSLGALTRGERRSAGNGLFRPEDNLESPWAYRALQAFYLGLYDGTLGAMSREEFERKTGLSLLDSDGGLKEADAMPPMHTWLNRVLALRITDQNVLFEKFEAILGGILERADASGKLERGMEDVEVHELDVRSEEVIRTDASTGAETRLVTFAVKTRRRVSTVDEALRRASRLDPAAVAMIVNDRTGEAAVLERGLTTIDDKDRLVSAVRIIGHLRERLNMAKTFEESAWEIVEEPVWRAAWDVQVARTDPWRTHELILVTGLLLPIWKNLPRSQTYVRRVTAPDGRRWLGRVLDSDGAAKLKVALGLTSLSESLGDAADVERRVLAGAEMRLSGGMFLRKVRYMDRARIEVVNGIQERSALRLMGCVIEVANYTPRVFVPLGAEAVLRAVLARHPVEEVVTEKAAA